MSDRSASSREVLSALADGEASASDVAQACAAWRTEPDTRATWHDYQLIGDVMRSPDVADASSGAAFLNKFRDRLAQEPVVLAPSSSAVAEARRAAVTTAPVKALQPLRRRAWAGPIAVAASFLALVASFLGNPGGPMEGGQGGGAILLGQGAGSGYVMSLADSAAVSLADQPSFNQPAAAAPALVRDPRLDQALAGLQPAQAAADLSFSNAGALTQGVAQRVSFDPR
jgi:sigma-E factor negative regulatory protein RseA